MNERRIARIERQIKERIATALVHELADPRLGFVTVSRVEVDREMQKCKVFWSCLGDETRRRLSAAALQRATGLLRTEVAHMLHTRTVPELEFRFDESVAGSQHMIELLDQLRIEREQRAPPSDGDPPETTGDTNAAEDSQGDTPRS